MKRKKNRTGGQESETIVFLDNILEGRWMSSFGNEEDFELQESHIDESRATQTSDMWGEVADKDNVRSYSVGWLWDEVTESRVGREFARIYVAYRLPLDIAGLFAFVIGLF